MKKCLLLVCAALLFAVSAFPQAGTTASNTAVVSFTGASTTQILAPVVNTRIRIAAFWFAMSAASDITLKYGTGTNCGTGTTSISGVMSAITSFAPPIGPANPITLPVGQAFCITSTAGTGGGTIIYSRY